MEVSMKMIKGFKVYNHKAKEPWGIVSDICFDCDTSKVTSIVAETISIVPISKIIAFDEINNIINGAVVLKKGTVSRVQRLDDKACRQHSFKGIETVLDENMTKNRLRDIRFNFETGEMTDIVISKNLLTPKNSVRINRIIAKENIIYLQKEGGSGNV